MFYSYTILAKKGPLAKIWMAAHWNKKLTKNAVFQTNIKDTCSDIVQPVVPLALRVSGHLLLGVVRVYSRQVSYLFADCSDAMEKIRMAFRTGDVNLTEEAAVAKDAAINMAGFGDFDDLLPEADFEDELDNENTLEDDQLWMKLPSQTDFEDVPSSMDAEDQFLPPSSVGSAGVRRKDPTQLDDTYSLPGSEISNATPVFRDRDVDTPQTGNLAMDYDAGQDFPMEGDDMMMEDSLPPPMDSETDRRASKLSAHPLADMDIDGTPISVRVRPEVELVTKDDLLDTVAPAQTKAPARKSRKRKAPMLDESTLLPDSTLRSWRQDTTNLLLPEQTVAKRLRRQRETSQRRWLSAAGYENPDKVMYLAPCMRAAAPELLETYDDIARGGFPALSDGELSDENDMQSVSMGGNDMMEQGDMPSLDGYQDEEEYQMGAVESKGDDMASVHSEEALPDDLVDDNTPSSDDDPHKLMDMMKVLDSALQRKDTVVYQEMSANKSRRVVADCFWKMLKLKSLGLVELDQDEPFGDIEISKTDAFDKSMQQGHLIEVA